MLHVYLITGGMLKNPTFFVKRLGFPHFPQIRETRKKRQKEEKASCIRSFTRVGLTGHFNFELWTRELTTNTAYNAF